jgi:ABC-type sugar transport system permease subunit
MAERNEVAGGSQMRIVAVVVGLMVWVLVSICCIGVLVLPTARVAWYSLMDVQFIRSEASEPVGLANYERLVEDQMFTTALSNVLKLTVARLAAVVAIPLLLAIVVNEFGRWVRIPARLLFTVPMALFAPTLVALAYQLVYHPRIGLMGGQTLADPEVAWSAMVSVDRLSTLGLAWGIGLIFFLAALRGSGEGEPSWRKMWLPVVAAWVVGLLATAALAVQSFVTGYAFMGGGPRYSTITLAIMQFMTGFRMMRFGVASAVAMVILVVTMILGLIAGLIVVFGHLRLEMVPWAKRSGWFSGGGKPVWRRVVVIVLCVVVLLVGVGACSVSGFPWLLSVNSSLKSDGELLDSALMLPSSSPSLDAYGSLVDQMPVGRIWINTIVPPLITVLLQVLVAYVGALGIGAARPLKRWSELLLLPFSPWLFVTAGPLSISFFEARRAAGLLNTLLALIPPVVLSVPMLFVLTLFFKGQVPQVRAARAEGRSPVGAFFLRLILPSLPLVALLACFSLLVSGQNLMWQLGGVALCDCWPSARLAWGDGGHRVLWSASIPVFLPGLWVAAGAVFGSPGAGGGKARSSCGRTLFARARPGGRGARGGAS